MQNVLFRLLDLPLGPRALDASYVFGVVIICGVQQHRLRFTAVSLLDIHVYSTRGWFTKVGLVKYRISVRKMDCCRMESILNVSFDGAYTMQTLGHAIDASMVLDDMYIVVKLGDHLAIIEVERKFLGNPVGDTMDIKMRKSNKSVGYNTIQKTHGDYYADLVVRQAGFVDVQAHDYSESIKPMGLFVFYFIFLPLMVQLLGLEDDCMVTLATHYRWTGRDRWRLVGITARKEITRL